MTRLAQVRAMLDDRPDLQWEDVAHWLGVRRTFAQELLNIARSHKPSGPPPETAPQLDRLDDAYGCY